MEDAYQFSFEDVVFQEQVAKQPNRTAYVDESGSYGFDFSKEGTEKYYVLTAVIVDSDRLDAFHSEVEEIKKNNGLFNTEMKSSNLSDGRRLRIMNQLLPLSFRLAVLVADKRRFLEDTPLTDYKSVFIKHMNGRLYSMLYNAYPKLEIQMDETGWPEFQDSFRSYVKDTHKQYNMFNKYDFDLVNSKDEILIQVADVIGGSIKKHFLEPTSTNYLEMIRGKIVAYQEFPGIYEPYWGNAKPEDYQYDEVIYTLAVKKARDFIEKHRNDKSEDVKGQVAVLKYLLFYVSSVSSTKFVYSDELIESISQTMARKIRKDYLFRRIIAPLRDEGVILSSCSQGYKIPISVADIVTYLNQQTSIVGPILHRMGICRNLIKEGTDNNLDVFNDPAFVKYKHYFE